MNEFFEEAKKRMPTQKEMILNALREVGQEGLTNEELNKISYRYSDRIYQLKTAGYVIDVELIGRGLTKYTLQEGMLNKVDKRSGIEVVKDEIDSKYDGKVTPEQLSSLIESLGLNVVRKPNVLNRKVV